MTSRPLCAALVITAGVGLAVASTLAGAPVSTALLAAVTVPATLALLAPARRIAAAARRVDIFSPLVAFPALYVAWFAVGSIDLIEIPASFSFGLFEPVPQYVLGYAALGLCAYLAGVALGRRRQRTECEVECVFNWRTDRFLLAVAALEFLQLASFAYIIVGLGAIPSLSADAGEIRLQITRFGVAEAVLFTCAWTLIPMSMMYVWRQRPRRRIRWACLGGAALSCFLLASLGGRSYLVVPLLTTLVVRHYGEKKFGAARIVAVGIVLFLALSFSGYLRDTALYGHDYGEDRMGISGSVLPFIYAYFYVRYPVATFRDITEVIPRKIPYQNGALTFGPLATLLPGHHEQSDMFFKNILGNDFIGAGQPATLLGPLYADAGVPGILLGMFLVGWLISCSWGWMRFRLEPIRVLLHAWLVQTLLFSLFANLFPYITTLWIPVFWLALNRFMRKA